MIAISNGRVAAVDFVGYDLDSDQYFSQMDGAGRQRNKDLPGRGPVDRFNFLVEVSGINYPNFIRPGWISRSSTNLSLVKQIVTLVKNYFLLSDVFEPKFQLDLE